MRENEDGEFIPPLPSAPQYRWELLRQMVDNRVMPSRRPEDDWLRTGHSFLSRMRRGKTAAAYQLQREQPDLYRAYTLSLHRESESWIIEAGLLTDVSYEELAQYIHATPEAIKLYEFYFYNVRDKLSSRGYVLNHILMPSMRGGLSQRDFDFLYKTLAYCAGWPIFKEFFELHEMDPKVEMWVHNSFRSTLLKKGWLALQRLEVNNYNALEVVDKCLELKRIEFEKGEEPARIEALELLKGLLGQCRLSILASTEPLTLDEPRAAEMLTGAKQTESFVGRPGA